MYLGQLGSTKFQRRLLKPYFLNTGGWAALLYSQKEKEILLKLGSTNVAFQATYAQTLGFENSFIAQQLVAIYKNHEIIGDGNEVKNGVLYDLEVISSMNTYGLISFSSLHAPFHPTFSLYMNIIELCILRLVSKCSSLEEKSWNALKRTLGCIRVHAIGALTQIEAMIVGEGYTDHKVGAVTEINNLEVTMFFPDPWFMLCLFAVGIISFYKRYYINKEIIKGTIAVGVSGGANGEVKEVYCWDGSVLVVDRVVVRTGIRPFIRLFKVHVEEQRECSEASNGETPMCTIPGFSFDPGEMLLTNLGDKTPALHRSK